MYFLLLMPMLVLAQLPLYVVDCGSHGDYMMSLAGPNATFIRIGLEGCDGPSFDEALLNVTTIPSRLSLSWGQPEPAWSFNLQSLLAQGELIWAGAGNDWDPEKCQWPASQQGVTAVAAVDSWGYLRRFSNGCAKKNGTVIGVSACSTSEATAVAASLSATGDILRWCFCDDDLYGILAIIVILGLLGVALVAWRLLRRAGARPTASPELASRV